MLRSTPWLRISGREKIGTAIGRKGSDVETLPFFRPVALEVDSVPFRAENAMYSALASNSARQTIGELKRSGTRAARSGRCSHLAGATPLSAGTPGTG